MSNDSCEVNLEDYKVSHVPPSVYYVPEFLSASEEAALLRGVYGAPRPKWTALSNRRLQNWGGVPTARGMLAEALPVWLAGALARVQAAAALPRPNHVLVNEYLPGQGILPHHDGDVFHPAVATLSLGSHTVLRLSEPGGEAAGALLLEPRSLLVLRGDAYTRLRHGIEERAVDTLDGTVANVPPGAAAERARSTRVSLTVRHVPNTSRFKLDIGTKR